VIFCSEVGLVPYLDLLDYILMKNIHQILRAKQEHNKPNTTRILDILNNTYKDEFDPSFKIVLVGAFTQNQKLIGFEIVRELAKISKEYKLNNFKAKIYGRYSNEENNQFIKEFNGEFDLYQYMDKIKDQVKKIYLSGSPQFVSKNYKELVHMKLSESKIHLI